MSNPRKKRVRCRTCLANGTAPVMHGFPTPDAFEAAERGEIVLGGCVIEFGSEQICPTCRRDVRPIPNLDRAE